MAKITQIQVAGTTYDLPGSNIPEQIDQFLQSRGIERVESIPTYQYRNHYILPGTVPAEDRRMWAIQYYFNCFWQFQTLEGAAATLPITPYVIPEPLNKMYGTSQPVSIRSYCDSLSLVQYVYIGSVKVYNAVSAFQSCEQLQMIVGFIDVSPITDPAALENIFYGCEKLTSFRLLGLSCNIDLSYCESMNEATLSHLIDDAVAQPDGFTITLPSGYKYDTAIEVAAAAKKITLIS